jgi:hypothetical protein
MTLVQEASGNQALADDCDDSGSSNSGSHDQLLDIDCGDEGNGQVVDVKDDHQISSSARQPASNGHDNVDPHNQAFSGILCDSADSSASGNARDHGTLG